MGYRWKLLKELVEESFDIGISALSYLVVAILAILTSPLWVPICAIGLAVSVTADLWKHES